MTTETVEVYNLASESLETRRVPDPYIYYLNSKGKLVSADTGDLVEAVVEKSTYLGRAEYQGLLGTQDWVLANMVGRIAWISPQFKEVYNEAKIIVGEIINTGSIKILFNRAIVLDDLTKTDCLRLAHDLSDYRFTHFEELRTHPIPLKPESDWLKELARYIDVSAIRWYIESGEDLKEKEKAVQKAKLISTLASQQNISHIQIIKSTPEFEDYLGNHPLRCNPREQLTSYQKLFNEALHIGTFECPRCHKEIPKGQGITVCPHCGARKEEFGSSCD